MQRRPAVPDLGRDLRAHEAQHRSDRTVLMERVDATGPRAVDVGADAGQGPRVLHGVRARRAHVDQARVPDARRAMPCCGSSTSPRRRELADARDADGHLPRRLQRAELREPQSGAEVPDAVHRRTMRRGSCRRRPSSRSSCSRSEPDIIKPITMAFDERGRLWVVEAMDYPNEVLDGNPGDDRIKILEDTNGDGRADKFTVFAEHLNMPTQPRLRQRRRHRRGGAAHPVPEGHERRRQGRRRGRC